MECLMKKPTTPSFWSTIPGIVLSSVLGMLAVSVAVELATEESSYYVSDCPQDGMKSAVKVVGEEILFVLKGKYEVSCLAAGWIKEAKFGGESEEFSLNSLEALGMVSREGIVSESEMKSRMNQMYGIAKAP